MTLKTLIKEAVKDYRISYWFGWIPGVKSSKYTTKGLCYYFRTQHGIRIPDCVKETSEKFEKEKIWTGFLDEHFWYPTGQIAPRLKILKRTLEKIEGDEYEGTRII